MDLPSASGKKGGGAPILLDPIDRAIPDLWSILQNGDFKVLRFF
jgi:hypothetical protein